MKIWELGYDGMNHYAVLVPSDDGLDLLNTFAPDGLPKYWVVPPKVEKRIKPDVFDGDDLLMGWALLTAPSGFSDIDPVGGLIAGATMPGCSNEGFQQHRTVAVLNNPQPSA